MHDNNFSDVQIWIDRIWKDVGSHSVFANIVLKVKYRAIATQALSIYHLAALFLSRHFFRS
jgi:hypothetical protein